MLLTEYFAGVVKVIEEYSKTHLITDSGLSIDCRTEKRRDNELSFMNGACRVKSLQVIRELRF